ncbi:hypothetical protein [Pedobacter agri]|uniref:hypothetical protein n=1 Tax=Pedobacter agri TaxID=454586 RepID=UPI00292FB2AE|nr:hypothetical protein [Pedobacter agri]
MVNIQYPNTLKVSYLAGAALKDENGDWIGGNTPEVIIYPESREQPNSKGAYVNGPDGKKIEFSSLIFVKGKIDGVPVGSSVEVFDGDHSILKGTVLKFSSNVFHSRIWV